MRALLLIIATLVAAPVPAAGPARLVRDIKVEAQSELWEFGTLGEFVTFGEFVYFGQSDGVHGFEPWRWSPATGPELFVDICPGACWSLPWNFVEWRGELYFSAAGPAAGREIWRTDGTRAGTHLVADIIPGHESSYPYWLTPAPEALYFVPYGGDGDAELWKSDGSQAGTARVADIQVGSVGSYPASLVHHEGLLYFTADDGVHGREIWTTDGTEAGTSQLVDLCPHAGQCVWQEQWLYDRRNAIAFVGDILFAPLDGGDGVGLASIDLVNGEVEYLPPYPRGIYKTFTHLGDRLLFAGYPSQLWRSDGTSGGTLQLGSFDGEPRIIGILDGLAYFVVQVEGAHELWRTDGEVAGTFQVLSLGLPAGGIEGISATPGSLLGDRLLFRVAIEGLGAELWSTDGSAKGTALVKDANSGPAGAFVDLWSPTMTTVLGDEIVYRGFGATDGWEPWRSDGTEAGTQRIADLFAPSDGIPPTTLGPPFLLGAAVGDRLLFGADDGATGAELWASDGTEDGTLLVADLEPGLDENGRPLSSFPRVWRSAFGLGFATSSLGVIAATGEVGDVDVLAADSFWGGRFEVTVRLSPAGGAQIFFGGLWESNGSPSETSMIADSVDPMSLAAVGSGLFFSRPEEETGSELWMAQGDPPAVFPVADIYPGAEGSTPTPVGRFSGQYVFAADDGETGRELWASDGTLAGTRRVQDIRPGPDSSSPSGYENWRRPAVTRWGVFFVADDGVSGRELWISDSTAAGTRRVADIYPGSMPSDPDDPVVAGDQVFFFANDGVHGRELWTARGDGSGARMIRDLAPGAASSAPDRRLGWELAAVGPRLYFGATDGKRGVELWTSDGTAEGTRMIQDINPGPGSSSPDGFVVVGDCLYFGANDGEHGFELWAMPIRSVAGSLPGVQCGGWEERPRMGASSGRKRSPRDSIPTPQGN